MLRGVGLSGGLAGGLLSGGFLGFAGGTGCSNVETTLPSHQAPYSPKSAEVDESNESWSEVTIEIWSWSLLHTSPSCAICS